MTGALSNLLATSGSPLTQFVCSPGQDARKSVSSNHRAILRPWTDAATPRPAFVEFRDWRDAREAYDRMHGVRVDGAVISVEVRFFPSPTSEPC